MSDGKATKATKATEAAKEIEHSRFSLDQAPNLPQVYDTVPPPLQDVLSFFDPGHEQDIVLTAALPVLAGCMPHVVGKYERQTYTPDLYTAVVGPPASGKGVASHARKLGSRVHEKLENEGSISPGFHQSLGVEETPPPAGLFTPGNTSARALFDTIDSRGGRSVIFQTEIDTVANPLHQDWGGFGELLRCAFHHEHVSIARKGEHSYIDHPELSVFLSGTENQFLKLVPSTEDGLFSRFALYHPCATPEWKSQQPSDEEMMMEERLEDVASDIDQMHTVLNARDKPLEVVLTSGQWDLHDTRFGELFNEVVGYGYSSMQSVVKRAGIVAFRMAIIFAVLRKYEVGTDLGPDGVPSITPSDEDFKTALALAITYADHSIRFSRRIDRNTKVTSLNSRMRRLYDDLPEDNKFTTAEAYQIGKEQTIPERTVREYLTQLTDKELLERMKKGVYRKT